jgi:hypothetical protein
MLTRGRLVQKTKQPCHCTTLNRKSTHRPSSTPARAASASHTTSPSSAGRLSRTPFNARPVATGNVWNSTHSTQQMA